MEWGIWPSRWCESLGDSRDSSRLVVVLRELMRRIPTGVPAWRRSRRFVAGQAMEPWANCYFPVGSVPVMTDEAQRAAAALVRIEEMPAGFASLDLR